MKKEPPLISTSTPGLNAHDQGLLQKLLPLFSPEVTRINNLVGFVRRNGMMCYFNYLMPIYHHRVEDMASFKVFLCQLILIGNATPLQIKRAFGLASKELKRWLKQYKQEGPAGFYHKPDQVSTRGDKVNKTGTLLSRVSKLFQEIGHSSLRLKKQ